MDRMRSKLFCANPSYFVEKIWRHAQKYVLYAGVPRFTVDFLGSFLYYSFQENSYFAFRKLGTIYERSLCYYPPQAYPLFSVSPQVVLGGLCGRQIEIVFMYLSTFFLVYMPI